MQESTAKTATEWVFVAKSMAQLPDGQSHALRCMSRAVLVAQDVHDWVTVANAWAQNFNDDEMAQQCIDKAKSLAEDSGDEDDWVQIGSAYAEMGNYGQTIKIYREFVGPRPWEYLAELKKMGPYPDGTTVLDWVEPGMTERASRDSVESADAQIANHNYKEAIRFLLEAEHFADSTGDWIRIARIWNSKFQDSDSAIECIEKAEKAFDTIDDLIRVARVWKNNIQNLDNAIRCMSKVEDRISSYMYYDGPDDWITIAKIWDKDFQDLDNAIRCMTKAEEAVVDFDDYSEIEETYRTCFPNLDDTTRRNAIERIVSLAGGVIDLGTLGAFVSRIGEWDNGYDEYYSDRRQGSCARYYSFTLAQPANIVIDLTSEVDTYLYLISGNDPKGEVLDENDDRPDDDAGGLSSTDSRIRCNLSAGTYTIEATTFEENETDEFTLRIYLL